MRTRQVISVATVAALALLAGACGGDDKADGTTTTEKPTETTVAKLSDEKFERQLEPLLTSLEAAGTDLCDVLTASVTTGPEAAPSTKAQVKLFVQTQAKILRATAATEPVDAANAAVVNATADQLVAAAEEDGYSTDFYRSKAYSEIFDSEEFVKAYTSFQERQSTECPAPGDDSGAPTTTG